MLSGLFTTPVYSRICFTGNLNTLVLRYICIKTHNVHRNKKCSVFHICLFNERYDFCDFDIGCSNVSTNFVMLRTRLYWIIKRKPKIHFLILGGGSCNFQPCFRGGSVTFTPKGGGWAICFFFINHISKCSGPPPPLPILFDQSLISVGKPPRRKMNKESYSCFIVLVL